MKPIPILHRELTPANVLVNKDCTVFKLSDFGQAKFRPNLEAYLNSVTPGSWPYMPPEAFDDGSMQRAVFSRKGDVFSLGVTMLQVATHCSPSCGFYGAGVTPEVVRRKGDLSKLRDHQLKPVILRCLRDNRKERPSASEILTDIENSCNQM